MGLRISQADRQQSNVRRAVGSARRARRYWPNAAAWSAVLNCVALAVVGCSHADHEMNAFLQAADTSVSSAEYVVQPPDSLEISSAQAAEIDGERQVVRQDGKITLRLLGEVKVAGMTPVEIAQKLEGLLSKYYVDPKVNVRVGESQSKRYYVFGDNTVARQGPFEYTGRDTLLNALAIAQPNNFAWKSKIKLIRPSGIKNQQREIIVDADRMIMFGKTDQNVLLQEGDIIWVPPTPLAWVGMRLGEVLFPMNGTTQTIATPVVVKATADGYGTVGITHSATK